MRCLSLASALRDSGATASFVCRENDADLCDLIEQRGFVVSRLPRRGGGFEADEIPIHAAWLGARWQEDAAQTRDAISAQGANPDWLVVDHYGIEIRWEAALRASADRVMVIDDLADRRHDCDLLLDQNLVAGMNARYADKIPAACETLLGPRYALLQPAYGDLHDRIPLREGTIHRILISFGGVDNDKLTERALAAFLRLNRPDIHVDVVVGAQNSRAQAIARQVAGHRNIRLHSGLSTLAPLIVKADFGIGAGGATNWERLCLGLPALVVTAAENQRPIARELDHCGLIRCLGHKDEVDEYTIYHALDTLLQQELDQDWSRRCAATVDGKGAYRVCAVMTATATTPLRVRHARPEDEALLLEWANDPTTRRNALSPEQISPATHRIWFRDRLRDLDGCRLYVIETMDGVPIGQVRFERNERAWEVHYALAPTFRRRGLGRPLLKAALDKMREHQQGALIFGRVRDDNIPSRKLFESLSFEARPGSVDGTVVYQHAF